MDRDQTNRHRMHAAVLRHFDDYPIAWEGLGPVEESVQRLRAAFERTDALAGTQHEGRTPGRTAAKAQRKAAMIDAAVALARPLRAYARATDDAALLARVDYSASDLDAGPEERAVRRVEDILAAGGEYVALAADYGVTAARIDTLRDALAAFHPAGAARDAAAAVGEAATATLPGALADARRELHLLDDLVPTLVEDADFVAAYARARRIDDR